MDVANLRQLAEWTIRVSDGDFYEPPFEALDDCAIAKGFCPLARAYLAEHPADSEVAIDEAWLRSVGFSDKGINGFSILLPPRSEGCAIAELFIEGDENEWFASICQGVPDDPKVQDDIVALTSMREALTRGDVRNLSRALGILLLSPMPEPSLPGDNARLNAALRQLELARQCIEEHGRNGLSSLDNLERLIRDISAGKA